MLPSAFCEVIVPLSLPDVSIQNGPFSAQALGI